MSKDSNNCFANCTSDIGTCADLTSDPHNLKCVSNIIIDCLICDNWVSLSKCQKCNMSSTHPYLKNDNTNCLADCSTDQTSNTCGDYIKDPNNKTCILTSMSNCLECTSSSICTKCFNNKYLDSDLINCVDACLE